MQGWYADGLILQWEVSSDNLLESFQLYVSFGLCQEIIEQMLLRMQSMYVALRTSSAALGSVLPTLLAISSTYYSGNASHLADFKLQSL